MTVWQKFSSSDVALRNVRLHCPHIDSFIPTLRIKLNRRFCNRITKTKWTKVISALTINVSPFNICKVVDGKVLIVYRCCFFQATHISQVCSNTDCQTRRRELNVRWHNSHFYQKFLYNLCMIWRTASANWYGVFIGRFAQLNYWLLVKKKNIASQEKSAIHAFDLHRENQLTTNGNTGVFFR